eukprot:8424522-Pyramimonas_sp.AAC.1
MAMVWLLLVIFLGGTEPNPVHLPSYFMCPPNPSDWRVSIRHRFQPSRSNSGPMSWRPRAARCSHGAVRALPE